MIIVPTRARKYRKRPVVVEAWQFTIANLDVAPPWVDLNFLAGEVLHVPTLEGVMRANLGDWIVHGVAGEVYPVKPEIFDATYELAPT